MLLLKVDRVEHLKKKQWSIADGKSLGEPPAPGSTLLHHPSGERCSVVQVGLVHTGGGLELKKRVALARLSSWAVSPQLPSMKSGDWLYSPDIGFNRQKYAVEIEHIREASLGISGMEIVVYNPDLSNSAGLFVINPDLRSGHLEWIGKHLVPESRSNLGLWAVERVFGDAQAFSVRIIKEAS